MMDPFRKYAAVADEHLNSELGGLHRQWQQADSASERDECLIATLWFCRLRPLPGWAHDALDAMLTERLPKAQLRDHRRWLQVCRERGRGLTWEQAYEYASRGLAGTPAAGSARTMKAAYQKTQRR
jgi:hypothetical protein